MTVLIGPPEKEVDYLVIGSGFGGSVMSAKLAQAGKNVCLLERGKAYPPGSFPRGLVGLGTNFWDPAVPWYGMYDVWSFDGIDAVVASGLGGGSLIYANVMLRKPSSWFEQPIADSTETEKWSFRYTDLRHHYTMVEKFLRVQELPRCFEDTESPKTGRLKRSSADSRSAPLAVRFRDIDGGTPPRPGSPLTSDWYGNVHGDTPRTTCTMCAECDIGCNDGAKSSMDHTYLSLAAKHGAHICVQTEVTEIRRCDNATGHLFEVCYTVHGTEETSDTKETSGTNETSYTGSIRAKRVVLAAGTLGSTKLMLQNSGALQVPPAVARRIGTRFCGNGDLLGFATPRSGKEPLRATKGPVITTYRQHPPGRVDAAEKRKVLQDGGIPALDRLELRLRDVPELVARWFDYLNSKRAATRMPTVAAESEQQATTNFIDRLLGSLPLLGMGEDVADGCLRLENGRLNCTWRLETSREYFNAVNEQLSAIAKQVNSGYTPNPQFKCSDRVITVHPLGGCPADTSESEGVVDSYGRVRGVPGLWITDGSVMPGPVGANPSLTIAAFARRAAMELCTEDLAAPATAEPYDQSRLRTALCDVAPAVDTNKT